MNRKFGLLDVLTFLFTALVFGILVYSLGFFTNLVQIRGIDRDLYDVFQDYVRLLFNTSIAGIVLIGMLRFSNFSMRKKIGPVQLAMAVVLSLGITVVSMYSLTRMPGFLEAYTQISIEDVRIYYPNYQYSDSVFRIGYVLFAASALIGSGFLVSLLLSFFRPPNIDGNGNREKEAAK